MISVANFHTTTLNIAALRMSFFMEKNQLGKIKKNLIGVLLLVSIISFPVTKCSDIATNELLYLKIRATSDPIKKIVLLGMSSEFDRQQWIRKYKKLRQIETNPLIIDWIDWIIEETNRGNQ